MNTTKIEAIADADAHSNNAGLPTYSELVEALRKAERELAYHASTRNNRELPVIRSTLARIDA